MGGVSINSHYVPQFILRNFYKDDKITYCDLDKKTIQLRNSRSVFSEEDYYPDKIEKDLCKKAEYQFANLYHNKLENVRNTLTLNSEDLFTIKKFLVVCAVRYRFELTEEQLKYVKNLGPGFINDYERNLNEILACENSKQLFDVLGKGESFLQKAFQGDNPGDVEDMNFPLWAELKNILHSYLVFAKARGSEKFLIPDVGRGIYKGPLGIRKTTGLYDLVERTGDMQILQLMQLVTPRDYTFYPLAPDFVIISIDSFFKLLTDSEFHYNVILPPECPTLSSALGFGDRSIITPPKVSMKRNTKEYKYDIKTLSHDDVCHFNNIMISQAVRYIGCANVDNIQDSILKIEDYTNRDLSFLKIE